MWNVFEDKFVHNDAQYEAVWWISFWILIRKELTMTLTVRELINALLSYEADEVIEITGENDETYSIVAFSAFSDLPAIEIKKDNK